MVAGAGLIITFYSWKGGVGRTMALANTGVQLARKGNRVLMVDWDLEAPGLLNYFEGRVARQTNGVGIAQAKSSRGLLGSSRTRCPVATRTPRHGQRRYGQSPFRPTVPATAIRPHRRLRSLICFRRDMGLRPTPRNSRNSRGRDSSPRAMAGSGSKACETSGWRTMSSC
jgi:hypothetical protein